MLVVEQKPVKNKYVVAIIGTSRVFVIDNRLRPFYKHLTNLFQLRGSLQKREGEKRKKMNKSSSSLVWCLGAPASPDGGGLSCLAAESTVVEVEAICSPTGDVVPAPPEKLCRACGRCRSLAVLWCGPGWQRCPAWWWWCWSSPGKRAATGPLSGCPWPCPHAGVASPLLC